MIEILGQKWTEIYKHHDPTIIASITTNNITSVLDKMAPRKLRTINGEVKNKLSVSKECLSMIRERNRLKKRAKSTGGKDDWVRWRKLKNQVNNKIRSEKSNKDKNDYLKVENDATSKEIWQMVERKAGWQQSLSPKYLKIDENTTSSPKKCHKF